MPQTSPAALPSLPARRSLAIRLLFSPGLRVLLLVGLMGWLLLEALQALGGPEGVRTRWGLAAVAPLVLVHAIVAVSPFPSEVIALVYGAIFGFALGWAMTWAGWVLGASLEYALFRRIASDVGEGGDERLPKWLRRLPAQHPLFLIAGRLVPFGNHAVNALAGSRRVPFGRFAWTSALAFLPFSAFVAGIASGLVNG